MKYLFRLIWLVMLFFIGTILISISLLWDFDSENLWEDIKETFTLKSMKKYIKTGKE